MDLHSAIVAHVRWKVRLLTAIETGEVPDRAKACVDNQCELGKWIHGHGISVMGEHVVFQRLKIVHAAFHTCLGPIIDDIAAHRETQARARIDQGDFESNTQGVVECLVLLKHETLAGNRT